MQIEGIKITDYLGGEEISVLPKQIIRSTANTSESKSTDAYTSNFKVDSNNYTKYGREADDENKIKNAIEQGQNMSEETFADMMYVNGPVSGAVVNELSDEGMDPLDTEVTTMVTVVDKIKMALAKAGKDITTMGGLSDEELKAMSDNIAQALNMASEISENISTQQANFLVKNNLEPTIENILSANHKVPQDDALPKNVVTDTLPQEEARTIVDDIIDQLQKQIDNIESSYIDVSTEEGISRFKDICTDMLKAGINLTADNIDAYVKYVNFNKPSEEKIETAIKDILMEGKVPTQAYLIEGYSIMDKARELVGNINAMDEAELDDVNARIQLEQIRLMMTEESAFTMIKNGIDVDTTDLKQLLCNLEKTRDALIEKLCQGATEEETNENVKDYVATMSEVDQIKGLPIDVVVKLPQIGQATLPQIREAGKSLAEEFKRLEMTYEAVGTEVRKDLGDSINKAFANVGDILEDLGFSPEDELAVKAVHALARNQLALTTESVTSMKQSVELLTRTVKNLTPVVVSELIKRGENPLDLSLEELNEKTDEIKIDTGETSAEEGFAKFLWKAEHTEGITKEQRDAYIGLYRLLNQIEKSDGAAIGALIGQHTEVTLRNLMTAVRSGKKTGKEYEVSDKVGALDQLVVDDLSITEQIEKVFLTNRTLDAKEAMTPEKMKMFSDENEYLDMNPDQFATAMESQPDSLETAYKATKTAEMQKVFEGADEEVINLLKQYDIPITTNMISAMTQFMNNKNSAFKNLFEQATEDEDEMEMLIQTLTERFGEACKTPQEMAEAQEALGILAENAMKNIITEGDTTSIDLKAMKLIKTQMNGLSTMAKNEQTYHIPIMVADEEGNMTLKIVKGSYDKGLVKMALRASSIGAVSGSIKYEANTLKGNFSCEREETRVLMSEQAPFIAKTIMEQTGLTVSFTFGRDMYLSENSIYDKRDEKEYASDVEDSVSTTVLYKAAKGLIDVVAEIFN